MSRLVAALALAVIAVGCGDRLATAAGGPGSPSPLPAPIASAVASATAISATIVPSTTLTPVVSGALTLAQLKYRIVDRFGHLWYCDPDMYPVARSDTDTLAEQRFPEVQKDGATFAAILAHLGYAASASYTHAQKLAIYSDWKMLGALHLDPAGGAYTFAARFTADERTGSLVEGTIDGAGTITVRSQTATQAPACPICLARGTRIATPSGSISVEAVREGMTVWTVDERGARVAVVVERTGSVTAPADHVVVHLVLADGRELWASPGHPLADGRLLGSLSAGDSVDGSTVLTTDGVPYGSGTTFDLLPAGPTGIYWADGVPLRSTIGR